MTLRHVNLVDLAEALETRLSDHCDLLAATGQAQATNYAQILKIATSARQLPCGIVVFGGAKTDDDIRMPAMRNRYLNFGLLLVSAFDAQFDAGGIDLWAVIDQIDAAFMPDTAKGESTAYPVAVLGDQAPSADTPGTWLIPSGTEPVNAGDHRSAVVYNLIAVDVVRDRT